MTAILPAASNLSQAVPTQIFFDPGFPGQDPLLVPTFVHELGDNFSGDPSFPQNELIEPMDTVASITASSFFLSIKVSNIYNDITSMNNKHVILIASFAALSIFGCSNPYAKDFKLTTIDSGSGYTTIELSGMGALQPVIAGPSDDYLAVRKYNYNSLTIYYQLLYYHRTSENFLNPKRLVFLIDHQKYILPILGSDKSDTNERAWVNLEPEFLQKFAYAQTVNISVEGSEKAVDYIFNKKYLYFFKRFYKQCVITKK